jgi:class 3 adenylate cyclase/pimeloyl-ACP methyl ester carboxylesterase
VLPADAEAGAGGDIVMVSGGVIPMEVFEDEPGLRRLLDGLRRLGRVIVFDRRGTGLSDPISSWERPVPDQWADDLAAVVDASGARDAVVVAWDTYGVATRFAVATPERVRMLVLHQPFSVPAGEWDAWRERRLARALGNVRGSLDDFLEQIVPTRAKDPAFRDWYARAGRAGASPATASRIWESVFGCGPSDQRLEDVAVPTLVLYRRDNVYSPTAEARLAAAQIPGSTLVELDGADHFPFVGDVDALLAEIADFVVGERRLPPPQRLLATVMFTDLVGSTERAASMGDSGWKSLLDRHDAVMRAAVGRCGGTVVKTTGDGVLALLPSAGVAVQVARRVRDELAADGLEVRIGLHLGDIDRRGDDVSGLAVNIAARVMAVAGAGDVVVTASVPLAVAGEAAAFEPIGARQLKGVPGTWDLYRLVDR